MSVQLQEVGFSGKAFEPVFEAQGQQPCLQHNRTNMTVPVLSSQHTVRWIDVRRKHKVRKSAKPYVDAPQAPLGG